MFRFLRPRIELKIQHEIDQWEAKVMGVDYLTSRIKMEIDAKIRQEYRNAIEVEVDRQLIARLTEELMQEIDFKEVIKQSMKDKLARYLGQA